MAYCAHLVEKWLSKAKKKKKKHTKNMVLFIQIHWSRNNNNKCWWRQKNDPQFSYHDAVKHPKNAHFILFLFISSLTHILILFSDAFNSNVCEPTENICAILNFFFRLIFARQPNIQLKKNQSHQTCCAIIVQSDRARNYFRWIFHMYTNADHFFIFVGQCSNSARAHFYFTSF